MKPTMNNPGRRPARKTATKGGHAPQRLRFALLLGGSAPAGELSLIEMQEGSEAQRFRFTPLADLSAGRVNYCLGLLPVSDERHVQRMRSTLVHRGRVGGKKPDPLLLLQATPEDFGSWPGVKRQGSARAALRQGVALAEGQ